MSTRSLPKPPKEVPVNRDLLVVAPKFRAALDKVLVLMRQDGFNPMVFETLRTNERQQFLFGFGRLYDDGRGVVTHSTTAFKTWHGYGLAADIVEHDKTPWVVPDGFWDSLGRAAAQCGLEWGGTWKFLDRPHVQWKRCPRSPTLTDRQMLETQGASAVWARYGAL